MVKNIKQKRIGIDKFESGIGIRKMELSGSGIIIGIDKMNSGWEHVIINLNELRILINYFERWWRYKWILYITNFQIINMHIICKYMGTDMSEVNNLHTSPDYTLTVL